MAQLLKDFLLLNLPNVKEISIQSHHSGKGEHVQCEFLSGIHVSATTNTCHTDANDTFEVLASAEISTDLNEPGQLYHLSQQEFMDIMIKLSKETK